MGQTADQLRQEIEHKREDAAAKIDQLETRVQELPQMARDTVDETMQKAKETVTGTVESVKQSVQNVDLRQQIEQRPLAALGAALVGGFLLGGVLGGGKDGQHRGGSRQGGTRSGLRGAAKNAGLDDTLATMSGALLGMLGERLRSIVDESFPEFSEKMKQQGGQSGSRSGAPSSAMTDASRRATGYAGAQAVGSGVHD